MKHFAKCLANACLFFIAGIAMAIVFPLIILATQSTPDEWVAEPHTGLEA